jgi:asparagine synthase (glutamine-hydrolysing)
LDERAAAARTAKALGTQHHEIALSEADMLHSIDDWLDSLDLPFGDASALAVYHLSKFARQHVTVALSGDGADELFGGYRRYAGWTRAKEMNPLAERVARSSLGQSTERLHASREHAMGLRIHGLQKFVHVLSLPLAERYAFLTRFVQPPTVARVFQTACPSLAKPETLNEVLLQDQTRILPGDMLVKVDRMSMAHGLEVRVPFLDPHVVAAARLLPENMRVRDGETKWALRQAVRSLLPKEVLEAPKHGFEIPMERWLTGPLASDVKRHLQPEYFTTQAGWIPEWIVQIRDAFFKKPTPELTHLVWNLWVLRRWLSR